MTEQKKYREPLFRTSGKNSFLEVFDNPAIDRMSIQITVYDNDTHKVTNKTVYYMEYREVAGICSAILNGQIDTFLSNKNAFPAVDFSVPQLSTKETMRLWNMSKTDKGNYQFTITERVREDKWSESAALKGKASFFISPFAMYAMASVVSVYTNERIKESFPPQELPQELAID